MYNLLVRYVPWSEGPETLSADRILEHTEEGIKEKFQDKTAFKFDEIARLPCLFAQEGKGEELARLGHVNEFRLLGKMLHFDITFDNSVAPMQNSFLLDHQNALGLTSERELWRTHWAIKDLNIYKFLLRYGDRKRKQPKVFSVADPEYINNKLVSVMMPFKAEYNKVYGAIQKAATTAGLEVKRGDEIWNHTTVIQDIVSLIDRSSVVVCDCSGRNANVFYEIGVAHSLGRDVIMITQSEDDVPADLRHHRFLLYLPNQEGLRKLTSELGAKLSDLFG